jgi:capsular polysaccharide biosynthesis protein/Mrp family chromosome partitioning ATPase
MLAAARSNRRTLETTSLVSVARRWWWTILLASLLAGTAGALFTAAMPASHEARVRMLVGPISGGDDTVRAAGQLTRTYAELVSSTAVVNGTISELGLPYRPEQLKAAISPTADSATRLLIVRVQDSDPGRAVQIANELSSQLTALTSSDDELSSLLVIDPAVQAVPVGVPTTLVVGLAGFAGLVGALTLVLLLENLDQSIRDEEELTEVSGVDYLGKVVLSGRRAGAATGGFVVETAPDSGSAADHRMLATKIELIANRDGIRSLLVLGVGEAQGSGELAANVAKVLADRRHCVTLLDANPHAQEITGLLALRDHPGLTDLLEREELSEDAEVHPSGFTFSLDPRLFVVPYGLATGSLAPHGTGAPWVLDRLLLQADFLLVNSAPVHRSAASLMWAGAVDATVLVVPRHGVQRGELSHLMESLRLVGTKPIGVVFEERRRFLWLGRQRDRRAIRRMPRGVSSVRRDETAALKYPTASSARPDGPKETR